MMELYIPLIPVVAILIFGLAYVYYLKRKEHHSH
jgi:hypothetical protein